MTSETPLCKKEKKVPEPFSRSVLNHGETGDVAGSQAAEAGRVREPLARHDRPKRAHR